MPESVDMPETPEDQEPQGRRFPLRFLLLIATGLLAGAVMAVLTVVEPGRGLRSVRSSMPTPVPDIVTQGKPAPDFTAQTANGETIHLSDYRGQTVALNFWATWCAPCEVEMPALQRASQRLEGDLVVLGVNAMEPVDDVRAYMDELGLTFPAVLDPEGEIIDTYEVRVFPTTVWIDANGVVVAEHYGALTDELIDDYLEQVTTQAQAAR